MQLQNQVYEIFQQLPLTISARSFLFGKENQIWESCCSEIPAIATVVIRTVSRNRPPDSASCNEKRDINVSRSKWLVEEVGEIQTSTTGEVEWGRMFLTLGDDTEPFRATGAASELQYNLTVSARRANSSAWAAPCCPANYYTAWIAIR